MRSALLRILKQEKAVQKHRPILLDFIGKILKNIIIQYPVVHKENSINDQKYKACLKFKNKHNIASIRQRRKIL